MSPGERINVDFFLPLSGRNEKGQLGHGDTKRLEAPKLIEPLADEVVVAAACGRNHTLALTEGGTAYSFGENKLGQLGQGNQTDAVLSPALVSNINLIIHQPNYCV